jgi:AbrB family looped-hinge helix DNA binding protein
VSKITSKLQVTIPKDVAVRMNLKPGDELEWVVTGEVLQVHPVRGQSSRGAIAERLALFDAATARQTAWQSANPPAELNPKDRGWTRAELYERRGRPR